MKNDSLEDHLAIREIVLSRYPFSAVHFEDGEDDEEFVVTSRRLLSLGEESVRVVPYNQMTSMESVTTFSPLFWMGLFLTCVGGVFSITSFGATFIDELQSTVPELVLMINFLLGLCILAIGIVIIAWNWVQDSTDTIRITMASGETFDVTVQSDNEEVIQQIVRQLGERL